MQISEKEEITSKWFGSLRDKICAEFEKIEEDYLVANFAAKSHPSHNNLKFSTPQKFARKQWKRAVAEDDVRGSNVKDGKDANINGAQGGGGEMSVMKGNVFEKVGVNISTVFGELSQEFRGQLPGTENSAKFFATGVSLVAHMASPLVPAVHMNTRFIHTEKEWFGGGADLNPMFEVEQDTQDFHQAFKKACDAYDLSLGKNNHFENPTHESIDLKNSSDQNNHSKNSSYEKFKKECDEYFFIKHRGVSRGVGGIFYDYLNNGFADKKFSHLQNSDGNSANNSKNTAEHFTQNNDKNLTDIFTKDFNFTKNVGLAFLEIFPKLVRQNMLKHWAEEQREHQLRKRGLYAEFNLIYDRGTKFGLMTGGNVEAILMSLPPVAKWD